MTSLYTSNTKIAGLAKMLLLPNELLINVLLRLPVKSLLRFKCVSKLWNTLISDPHFAKLHFELAAARTHKLLYCHTYTLETLSIDLEVSVHDDSTSAVRKLDHQLPKPRSIVFLIGSCRGLVLLWRDSPYTCFYIWNPSTSALKELPVAPTTAYPFFLGFGYDPSTDGYLVVHADRMVTETGFASQFMFISMNANSWEMIKGPCLPYWGFQDFGLPFNGALHWFGNNGDKVIVAFDLVGRSFSEIPLPNANRGNKDYLLVHGGFLSLFAWDSVETIIWVMREYRVPSSWTKSVVLPHNDTITRCFIAVWSTNSGDIYGKNGRGELVKCNANGNCSYILGRDKPGYICSQMAMYVESLHPLPGGDNRWQVKTIDRNTRGGVTTYMVLSSPLNLKISSI